MVVWFLEPGNPCLDDAEGHHLITTYYDYSSQTAERLAAVVEVVVVVVVLVVVLVAGAPALLYRAGVEHLHPASKVKY